MWYIQNSDILSHDLSDIRVKYTEPPVMYISNIRNLLSSFQKGLQRVVGAKEGVAFFRWAGFYIKFKLAKKFVNKNIFLCHD